MRPCRIVFAVLAMTAIGFSGCQSPHRTGFLGIFPPKLVENKKTDQTEDEPFILNSDEKMEGETLPIVTPKPALSEKNKIPSVNTHNQETLTYIDRELRDASSQERVDWFKKLKPLSADMVRLILQTRRLGIERSGQKANSDLREQTPLRSNRPSQSSLSNNIPSLQRGYANTQNPAEPRTQPNGPYGDPTSQNQSNRSQPVRVSAADPRQNSFASNKINNSQPENQLENNLLPPPAPPVSNKQFPQKASSPMTAIQTPQQPLSQSQLDNLPSENKTQRVHQPRMSLETEQSGTNILWNEEILRIISLTESDVARMTPGSTDDEMRRYTEKHVFLRMLYLMAGKQAQAFESIPRISPEDQEFWQQILWGIANYFYADAMPEKADRSAQALAQIRNAIERLQVTANLEIKNVAFCKKITNFGNFEKFERDEFRPGDTVLIYAEVENFKSESTEGGKFRTVMKSDIEILRSGANGGRVDLKEYSPAEDFCSSPRRDYFHAYRYVIPRDTTLGPHVLKLTIEDQLGGKIASYTMNFTIK